MEPVKITVLLFVQVFTCAFCADPLGTYNTDASTVTVSGFSSGASFSTQIHVALSSEIYAASILTGSPYGCNIDSGEMSCFEKIRNVTVFTDQAEEYDQSGEIDPVENMIGSSVFVWVHSYDCSAGSNSFEATVAFYEHFGADVTSSCNEPAGHGYPTLYYGNPCPYTASPYINDCDYNMAFVNLDYLLDGLVEPEPNMTIPGQLLEYDQAEFVPEGAPNSFDDFGGYIYIPTECESGDTQCRLHVFFHGCTMGREYLVDEVVRNVGLLEVAEVNNIVTLFPQLIDRNGTRGCWDDEGSKEWSSSCHDTRNDPPSAWSLIFTCSLFVLDFL